MEDRHSSGHERGLIWLPAFVALLFRVSAWHFFGFLVSSLIWLICQASLLLWPTAFPFYSIVFSSLILWLYRLHSSSSYITSTYEKIQTENFICQTVSLWLGQILIGDLFNRVLYIWVLINSDQIVVQPFVKYSTHKPNKRIDRIPAHLLRKLLYLSYWFSFIYVFTFSISRNCTSNKYHNSTCPKWMKRK